MISIVVLTHNRIEALNRTLHHLALLQAHYEIIVIDNASTDGTYDYVKKNFRRVKLLRLSSGQNVDGRNAGVEAAAHPYVAFCDDDAFWPEHSLARAVHLFERFPFCGLICARIKVGAGQYDNPVCLEMAKSPLQDDQDFPGKRVLGFLAGGSIVRKDAFQDAGGFHTKLHIGGEEPLLAWDLARNGWKLYYVPDIIVYQEPEVMRNQSSRTAHEVHNDLLISWMRRPMRDSLRTTWRHAVQSLHHTASRQGFWSALKNGCWAFSNRRMLPEAVENEIKQLKWK